MRLILGSIFCILATLLVVVQHQNKVKAKKILSERELLVNELTISNQEASGIRNRLHELTQENKRLSLETTAMAKQNESLASENTRLKNQLDQMRTNFDDILAEKQKFAGQMETLQSEKQALIEQVETLQSESFMTETLKEKALLEIQVTRLKESLKEEQLKHTTSLNQTQNHYKMQVDKLNTELQNMEKKASFINDKDKELLDLRKEISLRDNTIRNLEQALTDSKTLAQSLAGEITNRDSDVQKQKTKMLEVQKEYNVMMNQLTDSRAEKERMEQDITALKDTIAQKDNQITDLKHQLSDAQQKLKLRLQELGRAKDSIETIMTRTRNNVIESGAYDTNIRSSAFVQEALNQVRPTVPPKSEPPHYTQISGQVSANQPRLKGQIIEIDRTYDFVIINLGDQNGLQLKDKIQVLQNNHVIGDANIIEIRKEICAASVSLHGDFALKVGDLIEVI